MMLEKPLAFTEKRVKSVTSHGRTYHYHKATGERLPDDISDPKALEAAISEIEKKHRLQSPMPDLTGRSEIPQDRNDLALTQNPDMAAFTIKGVVGFVLQARSGDRLLYHNGDLARDAGVDALLCIRSAYLRLMAEFDIVLLRQKRSRPGWTHYFATRTQESLKGVPQHVLHADISPQEYITLVAVNERQSAKSVTRTIRDALATTDNEAAEIRNSMIRRGWLTNGRPPELTELGLSLLG